MGAIIPTVYKEFCKFSTNDIMLNENYYFYTSFGWNAEKVYLKDIENKINPDDKKIINSIIKNCNLFSNSELIDLILNTEPYQKAIINHISPNIITTKSILDFYNK